MLPYLIEHYGDIASVVGLLVTFFGFVVTLRRVKRAEQAARDAEERIALFILASEVDQSLRCLAKIEAACYDRRWVQALTEGRDLQILLTRIRHEQRVAPSEIASFETAQGGIDSLIPYFQRLAKDPKPRELSNQKLSQLNQIVASLTTFQARLRAEAKEARGGH